MLPVPIAGIMLVIGQRPPAVRGAISSLAGIMLLIDQRPSAVRVWSQVEYIYYTRLVFGSHSSPKKLFLAFTGGLLDSPA